MDGREKERIAYDSSPLSTREGSDSLSSENGVFISQGVFVGQNHL